MSKKDEVWPLLPDQEPSSKLLSDRNKGLLVGITVNLLCCIVLIVAALGLTAISSLSTFVLTYVSLIQGILIALPVIWAFKSVREGEQAAGFALGLLLGIVLQLGCFFAWYEHWIHIYAG